MEGLVKSQVVSPEHELKPTANRQARVQNAVDCKRHAVNSRLRQGVKFEAVASVLLLELAQTKRLFYDDNPYQFSYGDLFLLARAPETAAMVREMLTPLLEIVDRQSLRLSDLEGLANTSTGRHVALEILRSTVERLEPVAQRADTREVAE